MRFWDSSAIIPLIVREKTSAAYLQLLRSDPSDMIAWWLSPLECVSALCRKQREGRLAEDEATSAMARLRQLEGAWTEVEPVEKVRRTAARFLRVHALRAADALQLSAAWAVCGEDPGLVEFVTSDSHLADAASKEGFRVRYL